MLVGAVVVQDYCTWLFWRFLYLNAKGITETSQHGKFHANPVLQHRNKLLTDTKDNSVIFTPTQCNFQVH